MEFNRRHDNDPRSIGELFYSARSELTAITFAEALQSELDARNSAVGFSKHAMKRIESRNIEILDSDMLQRLNDGIEIAAEKGSNETLVLVDRTAFVVSVKNRTVITTMSQEDLKGNIFTNIDSTVIM